VRTPAVSHPVSLGEWVKRRGSTGGFKAYLFIMQSMQAHIQPYLLQPTRRHERQVQSQNHAAMNEATISANKAARGLRRQDAM
jgi:hypothetical protein